MHPVNTLMTLGLIEVLRVLALVYLLWNINAEFKKTGSHGKLLPHLPPLVSCHLYTRP